MATRAIDLNVFVDGTLVCLVGKTLFENGQVFCLVVVAVQAHQINRFEADGLSMWVVAGRATDCAHILGEGVKAAFPLVECFDMAVTAGFGAGIDNEWLWWVIWWVDAVTSLTFYIFPQE